MRIGLIGTDSPSKITTAKLLERQTVELYHPGVIEELAAEWGLPKTDSWKFQKAAFDRKIEQDLTYNNGIFDHTLLDHFAYSLFRCSAQIDDSICKSMVILTQENLEKYDLLFYFPIYANSLKAGLGEIRMADRIAVDLLIQGLIKEMGIDAIHVPDIGPISRTTFVAKHIELRRMEKGNPARAEGEILARLEANQ